MIYLYSAAHKRTRACSITVTIYFDVNFEYTSLLFDIKVHIRAVY